jgi:hypothetical protein
MGKSDPHIFQFYRHQIPDQEYQKVAFLGFSGPSSFTNSIRSKQKHFFDLTLENWNINDKTWNLQNDYDFVICTRCPYFSKNPKQFIQNCISMTQKSQNAAIFLDWGLGDHWRFENFKIGWIKNGDHEFAYNKDNLLWSCIWKDEFLENSEFIKFCERVKKFNYFDVKNAIIEEVPVILNLDNDKFLKDKGYQLKCDLLSLWEDQPQLYISLLIQKSYNIT